MSSSSQNPDRDPTRREELLFILRHGGAATDEIADRAIDMFAAEREAHVRAEVLREAATLLRSWGQEDMFLSPQDLADKLTDEAAGGAA